jgi:GxxExxY protein
MLKIYSPLSADVENTIHETIGSCIAVHKEIGPGMRETVYSRAMAIELRARRIPFEREKPYSLLYRGELVCEQRLDFVVASAIVLEIKAIERIADLHHAQLLHYLRMSRMRVGLLINFNIPVLKNGIVRKIL